MSDDSNRTHDPTPKRKADFRKRGEIALSRELVSAGALIGAVIALTATAGSALETLMHFFRDIMMSADGRDNAWALGGLFDTFVAGAAPALIGACVVSIVTIGLQLGWPPTIKGVKFDLSKMNPMANLGNVFGPKEMAKRTLSTMAKLVAIGGIVVMVLVGGILPHAVEAGELGTIAFGLIKKAVYVVVGAITAIAAVDYIMSKRRINEQMKMTPDEVKREYKEQEGDPMVKGRRRQRAREMAKRRIAVTVPTADVVVVNPTHYSVALRYDDSKDGAPVVVAKGVDEAAAKIREIARQSGVPVLERPPLARALHKHVKEGKPVPANLYRAVAEVLAYVYRLRGAKKR